MPLNVTQKKANAATGLTRRIVDRSPFVGGASGSQSTGGSSSAKTSTTMPRPTSYSTSGAQAIGGGAASTIVPRGMPAPNPSPAYRTPATGIGTGGVGAVNPAVATGGIPAQTFAAASTNTTGTGQGGGLPGTGGQGGYRANDDPITGWLGNMGYTPADVLAMNQMPSRYLYDILSQQGLTGPNGAPGGLFYMMEPLADIMMPLYELMNGTGTKSTAGFSPESIGNFMGYQWDQMMTPGGRLPSMQGMLNNLLGTSDQSSVLGSYLNGGTPEEQVENLRRYAMLVGQLSGSPMYSQALSNALSGAGYQYLQDFQGGQMPSQTYGQQLQNGYGGMFGFR